MDSCPVCKARYSGKRQCHRCKADIGMLADIEDDAASYREQAQAAYQAGEFARMLDMAERSCSLRKTPEAIQMMACAALLARRFDTAMQIRNHLS